MRTRVIGITHPQTGAAVGVALLFLITLGVTSSFSATGATPGPFVSLIFSRTEMSAADNCTPNNTGIAQLATAVAPYLKSMGMMATGTLATAKVMQSSEK